VFHYFSKHLSKGFTALFLGRLIQFAANGLLGLFLPVYLYTKFGYSISSVFFWYLAGSLVYILAVPAGAKFLNRYGIRRALRTSVIFNALFIGSLYGIDYNPPLMIGLSIVFLTLFRIFFWYPYQVDFAKFTGKGDRGKDVSLIWASRSLLGVIMPIAAGWLIGNFGFQFVFIIFVIIWVLSDIPFMHLPRTREKFSWSYKKTWQKLLDKKNRRLVMAQMANGAENGVVMFVWPIFIWKLLDGDFFRVGYISSLIVFVTIILQLIIGKYVDALDKRKMLHWGSSVYALGWVAKIFVLTPFHIFAAGAYHSIAQIFKDTPFDALNYEIMADHGHYVDEYTVVREMAVHFGRVAIALLALVLILFLGLSWTFALAAVASLLINFL